jgi:UDP-N-acetylmuramate--alanine ligase
MDNALNLIFPTDIGAIHFVGIGGIGMSGIAEILNSMGYNVQGSDIAESYVTDRLVHLGIKVSFEQVASNVENCSLVVKSTIIKDDNPEIMRAHELSIPVIKRSEMLTEIMRFKNSISISGTHGKTTTTSLVACLLEAAGLNPTVINGGIINNKKTNAYIGSGSYLVAEADESDGTFIKVPSYVGVITNIDPEHLDYYQTFENSIAAYRTFITNLPFYGFGVLCYDHPIVRQLGNSIKSRRIISYGLGSQAVDLRAVNIRSNMEGSTFDIELSESYVRHKKLKFDMIRDVNLRLNGRHNISNSLSAIAIGLELGIESSIIARAFSEFGGVKRRFTKTGEVKGITFIDDYAHHPIEIMATLSTAQDVVKSSGGRVIAVMQPHKYSRLCELFDEFSEAFNGADEIIISDVYSAGEKPIPGVDANELIRRIKLNAKRDAIYLSNPENLPELINKLAKSSDLVVFLGAGNITKWAYDLPKLLETLYKRTT